jgi:hypothetical protein
MGSNHLTKVVGYEGGTWQAKCSCRTRSPVFDRRWEAEDWNRTHLETVARARAHLRDRVPSLKDQRDWFRKQAAKATDEQVRRQWISLADELDHRLGRPVSQEGLF